MPPKQKLTRYDAAYDHLGRGGLGFTKKDIRAKIDSLLNVYGAEGWIFIEDGAYSMLIEHLLEDQEKLRLKGKKVEERKHKRLRLKEKEEDQHQLFIKELEDEEEDEKSEEQPPLKIFTLDEINRKIADRKKAEAEASKVNSQKRIAENGRLISVGETSNTIEIAQPTEVEISDPTGNEIPQRCIMKPCFGFYCSDDDGEDDSEENYVYYETKASLRERMAKKGSATLRKESMSRWDVVGV